MARPTKWLYNARRRAGFGSQDALARELGVSRGAVGNWESGTDRPSMENAERLAVILRRPRSEVLSRFGYPIGGGEPADERLAELPPEWLTAIRQEIAAGVADGLAQVIDQLRNEGLLPGPDTAGAAPRRRLTA